MKQKESESMDEWAWRVLNMFADVVIGTAGDERVIYNMIRKEGRKIIKAIVVLIRPEHRKRFVEWVEKIVSAI